MQVQEPIFVLGVGRCGSTLLYDIISRHPQVAYMTGLLNAFPDRPGLSRLFLHLIGVPLVRTVLRRYCPAGETYGFWSHLFPGFSRPCRDLEGSDATCEVKRKMAAALGSLLTKRRCRLVAKITGWPRIGFLREVFPDARFLHIVRDGRAVVNSTLKTGFWRGWRGPQGWRWGELTNSDKSDWLRYDRSFVALAAIQYRMLTDAFEKARASLTQDDVLEIRYEDMMADPVPCLKRIAAFCELRWSRGFARHVRRRRLVNQNFKWQQDLTVEQQQLTNDILGNTLRRYGYK